MKLTRDSARHFEGGTGTANISIPVAVAETFRFGVFRRSGRPRAEFSLRLRFHSAALRVEQSCETNVMAYGVLPADTGHGDLRMVLPAAVRKVAEEIEKNDLQLPKNGDIFLMEWPNEEFDHFQSLSWSLAVLNMPKPYLLTNRPYRATVLWAALVAWRRASAQTGKFYA